MRLRSTTGGSKDLSKHFASGQVTYNKALLSDKFSAALRICRRARRCKRPLLAQTRRSAKSEKRSLLVREILYRIDILMS